MRRLRKMWLLCFSADRVRRKDLLNAADPWEDRGVVAFGLISIIHP